MEYSFWKRIFLLPRTMIAPSSSSSSAIFDGGESQTQIVHTGLREKLNEQILSDHVEGGGGGAGGRSRSTSKDYSDYFSTASLASSRSSSSSISRCDCSEKRCGCSKIVHRSGSGGSQGRTLWISCALTTIILLVIVLALVLTLTLTSSSDSRTSSVDLVRRTNSDEQLVSDSSLEFTEDGSSSNFPSSKFESVNYVDEGDETRANHHPTSVVISPEDEEPPLLEVPHPHQEEEEEEQGENNQRRTHHPQSQQKLSRVDLKKLSRQSWEFLNRKPSSQKPNSNFINKKNVNSETTVRTSGGGGGGSSDLLSNNHKSSGEDELSSPTTSDHGDGVVLPAVMVYTSEGEASNGQVRNLFNALRTSNVSKKSCCRTQKYVQTVKLDGCEPLKIVNKMCSGQCISVWIPGVFSSFPVCQPSRSHWKVVTLTCGPHRDKKKRVRVEKIRRCSCMEVNNEPT